MFGGGVRVGVPACAVVIQISAIVVLIGGNIPVRCTHVFDVLGAIYLMARVWCAYLTPALGHGASGYVQFCMHLSLSAT